MVCFVLVCIICAASVGPIFVKYSLSLFAISLFPVIILPFMLKKDGSSFFVIILFVIRLITSHILYVIYGFVEFTCVI